MARERKQRATTVGVAENGNSAVLVTVAPGGELLDRRRIELTERGLPTHPHHHEGSWAVGRYLNTPGARGISLAEAVALVERVRTSAARGAREGLEALAASVPVPIASIALRVCPELPPTTAERIADHRAQTVADPVMYREALAAAAEARGWTPANTWCRAPCREPSPPPIPGVVPLRFSAWVPPHRLISRSWEHSAPRERPLITSECVCGIG